MEVMAAAPAMARRAAALAVERPQSALAQLPPPLQVHDIARLAAAGDTDAHAVLSESGRWLGMGLA